MGLQGEEVFGALSRESAPSARIRMRSTVKPDRRSRSRMRSSASAPACAAMRVYGQLNQSQHCQATHSGPGLLGLLEWRSPSLLQTTASPRWSTFDAHANLAGKFSPARLANVVLRLFIATLLLVTFNLAGRLPESALLVFIGLANSQATVTIVSLATTMAS